MRATDDATDRLLAVVHAAGVSAGIAWAEAVQRYREGRALEVPPWPTWPGRGVSGPLSARVSDYGARMDPNPTDDLTGPQNARETR